ncbi:putative Acid phosphatase [Helianthus annuus]|uniref:acid phosphatase n=1 Tax=Helianthus annuus TaxID=4232 RepID=A0A251TDU7_HELAN|nr:putative Acid phosphatase [Helianthus annuus]KAJ0519388.1 putative Acid phosphatase [Helianthus annuus]KAJ0877285.1 putative Acid phosphatase [Helianthus annuus]
MCLPIDRACILLVCVRGGPTVVPRGVTEGDHELEIYPLSNYKRFVAYNARWRMPFEESLSTSKLYYSFEVSKVHVIMLGSYVDFDPGLDQYKWLEHDLSKVNRTTTPWLFVVVHAPWYNSNFAHQGEKESVGIRESMEELLYNARVDIVFAGQVLAYEPFVSHFDSFLLEKLQVLSFIFMPLFRRCPF